MLNSRHTCIWMYIFRKRSEVQQNYWVWPAPSGSENALDIENKSEQDNKSAVCWLRHLLEEFGIDGKCKFNLGPKHWWHCSLSFSVFWGFLGMELSSWRWPHLYYRMANLLHWQRQMRRKIHTGLLFSLLWLFLCVFYSSSWHPHYGNHTSAAVWNSAARRWCTSFHCYLPAGNYRTKKILIVCVSVCGCVCLVEAAYMYDCVFQCMSVWRPKHSHAVYRHPRNITSAAPPAQSCTLRCLTAF